MAVALAHLLAASDGAVIVSTRAVPLAWDVWAHLAGHPGSRPGARRSAVPDEALGEKPGPLLPNMPLTLSRECFLVTLARLPEVCRPWLRRIYDLVSTNGLEVTLFW